MRKGFTLIEMIIVVAVVAIVVGSSMVLFSGGLSMFSISTSKIELVQNARVAMNKMVTELRMASAPSIQISSPIPGHPEYQKIDFIDRDGDNCYFSCSSVNGVYVLYYKKGSGSQQPLTDAKESSGDKYYVSVTALEFNWDQLNSIISINLSLASPADIHNKSREYTVKTSVWVRGQ